MKHYRAGVVIMLAIIAIVCDEIGQQFTGILKQLSVVFLCRLIFTISASRSVMTGQDKLNAAHQTCF